MTHGSLVETIRHEGKDIAVIVSRGFREPGIHFFTPPEYSQQLAFMRHPEGKKIVPHTHNDLPREVHVTLEVLVIRRGKLRVDFFTDNRCYIESRVLSDGDVILLISGGHGFEVLEEVEMLEIKQGPHMHERDKTRFDPGDLSGLIAESGV